jgi:hypothetical protein
LQDPPTGPPQPTTHLLHAPRCGAAVKRRFCPLSGAPRRSWHLAVTRALVAGSRPGASVDRARESAAVPPERLLHPPLKGRANTLRGLPLPVAEVVQVEVAAPLRGKQKCDFADSTPAVRALRARSSAAAPLGGSPRSFGHFSRP